MLKQKTIVNKSINQNKKKYTTKITQIINNTNTTIQDNTKIIQIIIK